MSESPPQPIRYRRAAAADATALAALGAVVWIHTLANTSYPNDVLATQVAPPPHHRLAAGTLLSPDSTNGPSSSSYHSYAIGFGA
ncbi:MAG: hypothetical protein IPL39_23085 [Opitutaceae bacterium]|nr:hypothetical protein [Opitutaceae bacterium]